jgi:hypothetical protein
MLINRKRKESTHAIKTWRITLAQSHTYIVHHSLVTGPSSLRYPNTLSFSVYQITPLLSAL